LEVFDRHVEALVFCASHPIKAEEIRRCLEEMFEITVEIEAVEKTLQDLINRYAADDYSFEIVHLAKGYQFLSKPAYQASISVLLKQQSKKRLSNASLETLSIIVYKQPVTKAHIEQIRGVNCDYSIQKLLDKGIIEIKGKSDAIGKPLLYGTNERFMEYFGIRSLNDLPTPKDFSSEENSIGEVQD
jgi:segregation and condensation protein B